MRKAFPLLAALLATPTATAADVTTAPTVVFLHSLAGAPALWSEQIEALPEAVRVIAPAWPEALPEAGAPSIEALAASIGRHIDSLGIDDYAVVGHSAGASIALALAAQRPKEVSGLLLLDAAGDLSGEDQSQIAAFLEMLRGEGYREIIQGHWGRALDGAAPDTTLPVMAALQATPKEVVLHGFEALFSFDTRAALQSYDGPIVAMTSPSNRLPNAFHTLDPRIEVHHLDGVSHYFQLDKPEAVNAVLDAFLADIHGGK